MNQELIDIIKELEMRIGTYLVLTGSHALQYMGLLPKDYEGSGDIDLVISPTPNQLQTLEELREDFPHDKDPNYESEDFYMLDFRGKRIDIFVDKNVKDLKVEDHNIRISSPDMIIKAKLKQGRPKDFKDLIKIQNHINNLK